MSVCFYCGRPAHYQCDYTDRELCGCQVCEKHVVPEFEGGKPEDFALCMDHAKYQHKAGETIREWAARVYPQK